ncbi:S41 family peptidase [Marinitoga sp. 1138]|uniref:S41 family peptidase n=1 Tax=Marinitoga sp. 1138 TaxID=1643334 RepID=UPI0015863225|nr:S41 family peptidase [Marinitoga sp. 1138]NUU98074.1 hypothetical protein [Marinitoga sp. 1138]
MGKTKFILNLLIVAAIFYLIWLNTEYKLKLHESNIFGKMYSCIKNNYYPELTDEEIDDMLYNAIQGLHTKYSDFIKSNKDYVDLASDYAYKLGFTGKYNFKKQAVEVSEVFFGSKVYKEGLRSGDYIIAINGKDVRRDDIPSFENTENFTITVLNKNRETFNISFSKRTGFYKMMDTKVIKEKEKKFLIIKINYFGEGLFEGFNDYINLAIERKIDNIIIDLRNNHGGSLNEAQKVLSLLSPQNVFYNIKLKNNYYMLSRIQNIKYRKELNNKKIVVIVNRFSASASELVGLYLRDNNLATVIGERTYGKSEILNTFSLDENRKIIIPVGQYISLNGENISGKGFEPNIKIEDPDFGIIYENIREPEEDLLLEKAIDICLKNPPSLS